MSMQTFLHLEALEHAKGELANYERQLAELVRTDIDKAKADIASVVEHFKAEIIRIKSLIDVRVLAHLEEGAHPQVAVKLAEAGAPTNAEKVQLALAEQAKAAEVPAV